MGSFDVPITSVDIAPRDDDKLRDLFARNDVGKNVNLIVGDSQHTKYPDIRDYDVLFIDGDHTYEGCRADILNWYPKLLKNGHVVFHDSYLGKHGVQDAIIDFYPFSVRAVRFTPSLGEERIRTSGVSWLYPDAVRALPFSEEAEFQTSTVWPNP